MTLPIERLAPREREVFDRIVRGMSRKEIVFDLGVSDKTVSSQCERIYSKLGAHGHEMLMRLAEEDGLTPAAVAAARIASLEAELAEWRALGGFVRAHGLTLPEPRT